MHLERALGVDQDVLQSRAIVGDEGNVLIDQNSDPELKVPNPRVELPYTHLVAWYVMHCPFLMTAVHVSKEYSCKS